MKLYLDGAVNIKLNTWIWALCAGTCGMTLPTSAWKMILLLFLALHREIGCWAMEINYLGQVQQRTSMHSEELNLRFWIYPKPLMSSLDTASMGWRQWGPHHWHSGGRGSPNNPCRTNDPGKVPRNEECKSRDYTLFQQCSAKMGSSSGGTFFGPIKGAYIP